MRFTYKPTVNQMINVYLDTNVWIDIARAWYERDSRSPHKDIATYLKDKVAKQSIRLILSHFHCLEMLKYEDKTWRDRLWLFAVSLSGCTGLLNRQCIQDVLIEQAVSRVFNVEPVGSPSDPYTNSALFGFPFGCKSPYTKVILRTQEGWISFWLDMPEETREQLFLGMMNMEQSFIQRRNNLKLSWRKEDYTTRRRAYITSLFFDLQDSYMRAMIKIGKRFREDIESLRLEDKLRLVTEVPTLDVEVALATQHLQQWDRPEEINDIRDIGHLCMSVPYCDIVVTECYWIDKLKREKMDERYNTILLSDISTLITTLTKEETKETDTSI
jgi:hypothetical protein